MLESREGIVHSPLCQGSQILHCFEAFSALACPVSVRGNRKRFEVDKHWSLLLFVRPYKVIEQSFSNFDGTAPMPEDVDITGCGIIHINSLDTLQKGAPERLARLCVQTVNLLLPCYCCLHSYAEPSYNMCNLLCAD